MDEILGQLGGLLLGSVPTIIFIVLLLGIYTTVVHKPLVKVLAERHSRTEGAIEKARADISQAEARTAEYEQRHARSPNDRVQEPGSAPPAGHASPSRSRGPGADPGASSGRASAGRHPTGQGMPHKRVSKRTSESWQPRSFAPCSSPRRNRRQGATDAGFAAPAIFPSEFGRSFFGRPPRHE